MDSYSVYIHTNKMNGKKYIGITRRKPEYRWNNGNGYNRQIFGKAIKKYGWNNFDHKILFDKLTKEKAEQKEIKLIEKYKSNQREFGYNIENGGNAIGKISDETRKKISKICKGRHISEKTKKKMSESRKGKNNSEEAKKKMSNSRKGKYIRENNPFYGKQHSEETKKKISNSLKGKEGYWQGKYRSEETKKKLSEAHKGEKNHNARKIICVDTNKVFNTVTECANIYCINRNTLTGWLTKKNRCTHKYTFMYYDDYIKKECKNKLAS